eukprot:scaffold73574_cov41-Phaeocystis_antarctica.AAC.3
MGAQHAHRHGAERHAVLLLDADTPRQAPLLRPACCDATRGACGLGDARSFRLEPRRALLLALGLLGLGLPLPARHMLGARVVEHPAVQAEGGEEQRQGVEEGAREDEGVDGGIGGEVGGTEGAHQLVEGEGVELERSELVEQLVGRGGQRDAAEVGQVVAPAVDEAVGSARGRVGLDTASLAPGARAAVRRRAVPKEAGGNHRAVGTEVTAVALAHATHAVAMPAAVGIG